MSARRAWLAANTIEERKGDWIQTHTNVQFWPMDPRPSEIRLEDIGHALSNLCRFGGHCKSFYSVAQHSVLVSLHVEAKYAAQALMHDATEAYLVDVPTPIKKYLTNYQSIEQGLAVAIGARFGLVLDPLPECVKEQDAVALWTEKRDLRGTEPARWRIGRKDPWPQRITPWAPDVAYASFMARALSLGVK